MKYKIKSWISIDLEEMDDIIYETKEEAEKDKENMELMQPENKYEIIEIKEENKCQGCGYIKEECVCSKNIEER